MALKSYKYFHLYWLIPLFFLGLTLHQAAVYRGLQTTYERGTSYTANVLHFETTQILTQTNSHVVLKFEVRNGETHRRKLTIPIELTSQVAKSQVVPIRYYSDSFQPILLIAAYKDHLTMTLVNIAMAVFGLISTATLGFFIYRWLRNRQRSGRPDKLIINNIKTADS